MHALRLSAVATATPLTIESFCEASRKHYQPGIGVKSYSALPELDNFSVMKVVPAVSRRLPRIRKEEATRTKRSGLVPKAKVSAC